MLGNETLCITPLRSPELKHGLGIDRSWQRKAVSKCLQAVQDVLQSRRHDDLVNARLKLLCKREDDFLVLFILNVKVMPHLRLKHWEN